MNPPGAHPCQVRALSATKTKNQTLRRGKYFLDKSEIKSISILALSDLKKTH